MTVILAIFLLMIFGAIALLMRKAIDIWLGQK